jgi:intergrase/recombinase
MRVFFNFLEATGFDASVLTVLRKALPKGANTTNPDLKIPDEKAVQKSPRLLGKAPLKYRVLFNVLLDSGLRIVEAVQLIEGFEASVCKLHI